MAKQVKTILGDIHLEHEPEGFYYSVTTKDRHNISGGGRLFEKEEDAIEDAKITLEDYELNPDQYRD